METTGNFDGWPIVDVIAHIYKIAYPPEPPPTKEPAPPREEEEPGGYVGFCDGCGHTHAFCECY